MKKIIKSVVCVGMMFLVYQSYAHVPGDIIRFEKDTDCISCNLTKADFGSTFVTITKSGGKFDGSYFTAGSLNKYMLSDASMDHVNFVQATFRYDEFNSVIFQNANLSYANIYGTTFIKSTFAHVKFSHVSIQGSFSSCFFNTVDFTKSNLAKVSFVKTNMVDVNFEGANLNGADFSRVHMENVNFNNADLSYAILIGSNINEENLSNAKTYKCAALSNGEIYTNHGEYVCK